MSTTTSTPTPSPELRTGNSGGRTALIAIGGAAAGAAIVAGLVFGLGGGSSTTTSGASGSAGTTHVVVPAGSTTHHRVTPVNPPVPSQTIITLQRELGQLNYYEGPVTGTMNEPTVQAITYLQRDAGLPQTGTMNAATQAALQHMLISGNNQMGGNS
ncbi:MAG: peptidoglycan-binding protein [Pseudonocardia sp.]|nr:peptidoglycan-binding protein [Pseudonocardia sp.]